MTVEPGRRLAGRYRVEDLLAERAGARSWRAVDEVLRRSVAIDALPADAPRAQALVQAARRSAIATDSRFLRVLDAAEENGDVYVVREWARGETLDLVLAEGPLTHRRAAWVVREISEAMGTAHEHDIFHLRLIPRNVIVTDTGAVKITGLATDAALHGVHYADAEAEDVRGLGRLLYACLVTKWPGGPEAGLPLAPTEHGRLMRPQQVRAGVPRSLDETCDRILGEPPRHHATPIRHAAQVGRELAQAVDLSTGARASDTQTTALAPASNTGVEHTTRLHMRDQLRKVAPAGLARTGTDNGAVHTTARVPRQPLAAASAGAGTRTPQAAPTAQAPSGRRREAKSGPPWGWITVLIAVLAAAALAFYIGFTSGDPPNDNQANAGGSEQSSAPQPVDVQSVQAWDPHGEEGENDDLASLVIDGDPSSEWVTNWYENAEFGQLKPGLGLIVDLGKTTEVSEVRLSLGGDGTDLEIRAAPQEAQTAPDSPEGFSTVGGALNSAGPTTVDLDNVATTRFLLVWITKLPLDDENEYRAHISDLSVRG